MILCLLFAKESGKSGTPGNVRNFRTFLRNFRRLRRSFAGSSSSIFFFMFFPFLGLHFTYCQLLDCFTWKFFLFYKTWVNLLLRAIRFIKYHIFRDFNTPGGLVENTIGMSI